MTIIQTFKQELARVFDDNLHTKQWHNYVDYAIIGLIILCRRFPIFFVPHYTDSSKRTKKDFVRMRKMQYFCARK